MKFQVEICTVKEFDLWTGIGLSGGTGECPRVHRRTVSLG